VNDDKKDIPSFEDLEEALGSDVMSWMSEMVRPDPAREEE
jgi:hypothetical protein